MKAIVAHAPRDFRLSALPRPAPDGGAVIRVEAAGVCAADRMIFRGASPWSLEYPFVPGHEFVGTIEAIAPAASRKWGVEHGDRVTAEVIVPCDACHLCASSRYHLCRRGEHLGSALPGGWAEYMALPPRARVWRIPQRVAPWRAVLTEPLSCAVHAVARADVQRGDVVAVAGLGPIGAAALAVAALEHPRLLIAFVRSSARAELARRVGADAVIDVADDVGSRVAELTGGRGIDAFIEASGSVDAVTTALDVLAPGGRLVLYGVYGRPLDVDLNLVAEFKEIDVRGGHLSPGRFPRAIELIADGTFDAAAIVTDRRSLEDFVEAIEPSDGRLQVKAILEPYPAG